MKQGRLAEVGALIGWITIGTMLYFWPWAWFAIRGVLPTEWPIWFREGIAVLIGLLPFAILGAYLFVRRFRKSRARWGVVLAGLFVILYVMGGGYWFHRQASDNSASHECLRNLKTIGFAFLEYQIENDGCLPDAERWVDEIYPYVKDWDVFRCPADHSKGRASYAMNLNVSGVTVGVLNGSNERKVLLYECTRAGYNPVGIGEDLVRKGRHPPESRGFHALRWEDGINWVLLADATIHNMGNPAYAPPEW